MIEHVYQLWVILENGGNAPKTSTLGCPVAKAQTLLNKMKREEYVGAHRYEAVLT